MRSRARCRAFTESRARLVRRSTRNWKYFRNKKIFDLGSADPNKIEIRDGSKTYFLTRKGEDWWSGSAKKMDAGGVQELIDKIRDLSASKFVILASPHRSLTSRLHPTTASASRR